MRAAFFHYHRFTRSAAGVHYSNGSLPYSVLRRYVEHFRDGLLVVGRARPAGERPLDCHLAGPAATVASGEGVDFALVERTSWFEAFLEREIERVVCDALQRVDCAIVRLPSMIGLVAAREATRMRKPWVAEVVGCVWDALWNYGAAPKKVAAGPLYLLNRQCVGQAPRVLYVTQHFLQQRYPTTGTAIGCSDVLIPPRSVGTLDRRLTRINAASGDAPMVIGLVGSMDVGFKGHETAIRALGLLRDVCPPLILRFLGGGCPDRWLALARRLGVEDRIELSGVIQSGAPVMEWLDNLDVFIAPSFQEGLPRALTEAMSRALPALGSLAGGIPELLEPRDLHQPGDHRGLARLLRGLAASPDGRMARAARNFEKAREYDADVLDERRRRFLSDFAEEARSRRD